MLTALRRQLPANPGLPQYEGALYRKSQSILALPAPKSNLMEVT